MGYDYSEIFEKFSELKIEDVNKKYETLRKQFREMAVLKSDFDIEKFTVKREGNFIAHNSADALGEIKDPRAIEPLIAALKNSWIKKNVQEALWKITGRGRFYGGDRKKWKKWWKENKMRYLKNK